MITKSKCDTWKISVMKNEISKNSNLEALAKQQIIEQKQIKENQLVDDDEKKI
jgi:hypothetical protein